MQTIARTSVALNKYEANMNVLNPSTAILKLVSDGQSGINRADIYRQAMEALLKQVPAEQFAIFTTMPRGGLQLLYAPRQSDRFNRLYHRDMQGYDFLSWQAIGQNRSITEAEAFANPQHNPYMAQVMGPQQLCYAAAAQMPGPLLDGFPGVVHLYRSEGQAPFSAAELSELAAAASKLNDALQEARRVMEAPDEEAWLHRPRHPLVVVDERIQPLLAGRDLSQFDSRLSQQLNHHLRNRGEAMRKSDQPLAPDRLALPDSHGDLWLFRIVSHSAYPALGPGAAIFVVALPDCRQWDQLGPDLFPADQDMAKMVEAMDYLAREFCRPPTLRQAAARVHLSAFYFQRRFTELVGVSPKHFLVECQSFRAKEQLALGHKNLQQVARDSGFAHQSHFTSRFRQVSGLTPRRWANMAKNLQGAKASQ